MKILVACEESQAVCKAFRAKGHEAYSCDILPCSGGHPEWHIQGDALIEAYSGKYDLMVAHPPCTYLSNAGACRLYPQKGVLNQERYKQGLEGKEFFMKLFNAPIKYICVENPIPSSVFELPKYSQIIQPYEYGHPFSKKTCLWIKNLPLLKPTNIITENVVSWVSGGSKDSKGNKRKNQGVAYGSFMRSKTFQGIADAMAEQWSDIIN